MTDNIQYKGRRGSVNPDAIYTKTEAVTYPQELITEFKELNAKFNIKEQAVFFLNAFPDLIDSQGNTIYEQVGIIEEDILRSKDKHVLESLDCHRFFEKIGIEMSHLNFSKTFEYIDLDKTKTLSYLELLLHFNKRTLTSLLEAPQEIKQPTEELQRDLDNIYAEINRVKTEIDKIEAQKHEYMKTIEDGTREDGSFNMKAKIAIQELHALVNKEDMIFKLEKDIRLCDKKTQEVLKKIEDNNKTVSPGTTFWVKKEMENMNSYKPGNNVMEKLKMWEK